MHDHPSFWAMPSEVLPPMPRRIEQMYQLYGKREGEICGRCAHCIVHQPGQNRYRKCDLTAYTSGPATDWRVRWQACGKFVEREEGKT